MEVRLGRPADAEAIARSRLLAIYLEPGYWRAGLGSRRREQFARHALDELRYSIPAWDGRSRRLPR